MIYSSSSASGNWSNVKNHGSWNLPGISTSLRHAKPHWALGRKSWTQCFTEPGWCYSYLKGGDLEDRTSGSAEGRTVSQTMPILHNGARHKEPEAHFEWADAAQAEIPAQGLDAETVWRCISSNKSSLRTWLTKPGRASRRSTCCFCFLVAGGWRITSSRDTVPHTEF